MSMSTDKHEPTLEMIETLSTLLAEAAHLVTHLPIADSRNLFGNDEMRLIRSSIISTHTLSQRFGGQQTIRLDDVAFAVNPFGLNRVDKGGFALATGKAGDAQQCRFV
jgi:hypothetical protein